MASLILVTGGTGTLGKLVVPRLREAGAKVRVLSRQAREGGGDVEFVRGDLDTGAGIEAAVAGAERKVKPRRMVRCRLHRLPRRRTISPRTMRLTIS